MLQNVYHVTVLDWCVQVECISFLVKDDGTTVPDGRRVVQRFRIEDCTDKLQEDLESGEKSLTLLHKGNAVVVFSNQGSVVGDNTLNGVSNFSDIDYYFQNEFYQLRVLG